MDALNPQEQREVLSRLEAKQLKTFSTMYSKLVQRCFENCINDFSSKSLGSREEGCVMRCVDKNQKITERLGMRFEEQNASIIGQAPASS